MTTKSRPSESASASSTVRSAAGRATSSVLLVISFAFLILGDVLAFNQLATQSPTDAIVQILVFAIGAAGIIEGARRLLFPSPLCSRASATIPGVLGILAIAVWRAQLPVGFSVIITVGAAVGWGFFTFRLLGRANADRNADAEQILGLFSFAQTIVLAYISVLTAIDAAPALFS